MPLATLLTLEDGQTISCLPSQAGSFSLALDTIRDAAEAVRKMVARQPQVRPNSYGAICIGNLSLEDAFGGVRKVIKESGLDGGVLLGADTRAASNIRSATEFTYGDVGATSSAVAGADKCAGLVSLWKDAELFSIEDPVASSDPSASTFKPKVTAVLNTMAREGSSLSHSFAFQGIGGSEGCVLQIIADEGVSSMEDLVAMDDGFNAVNLRMDKFRCVSDALAFASSARAMRLALIVGVPEGLGVTTDSFAADLAVGLGVGQFAGGGLESGEYAAGYNRLLSIQIESESISFVRRYFRT
jgi:enolase